MRKGWRIFLGVGLGVILLFEFGSYFFPRGDSFDSSQVGFDVDLSERRFVFTGKGKGGTGLFFYEAGSKSVTRLVDSEAAEVTPRFWGTGKIVYGQENTLQVYDEKSGVVTFLTDKALEPVAEEGKEALYFLGYEKTWVTGDFSTVAQGWELYSWEKGKRINLTPAGLQECQYPSFYVDKTQSILFFNSSTMPGKAYDPQIFSLNLQTRKVRKVLKGEDLCVPGAGEFVAGEGGGGGV